MTLGFEGSASGVRTKPNAEISNNKKTSYRSDIQGLRAIAILSVLIFHLAGGEYIQGGFTGVDIFYVISGFLITGIIVNDIDKDRFSILNFYRRRFKRLLPALVVLLTFSTLVSYFILTPGAYLEYAKTALGALLFVSNIEFWKYSNYFDGSGDVKPLLNTWSLAVEEQFYIVYPVLVYAICRLSKRWVNPVLVVLWIFSLILSVWMSYRNPSAAFYLFPTRAFELLTGALVANTPNLTAKAGPRARDGLSIAGLGLIALSIVFIPSTAPFPGWIALAPVLGAALVIAAGRDGPSVGGALISGRAFVFFGNISYSLYLWHWPLLVFARHLVMEPLDLPMLAGVGLVSIVVAYLSWRWVEEPFLRRTNAKHILRSGGGAIVIGCSVCMVIVAAHGFPQRFGPSSLAAFSTADASSPKRSRCHSGEKVAIPYERNCVLGAASATPTIAVWADSHGAELAYDLGRRLAGSNQAVMQITASSCPPSIGYDGAGRLYCRSHNDSTLASLEKDPRISEVWMLANYSGYPKLDRPIVLAGVARSVRALRAAGKSVVLFEQIPTFVYDPPAAIGIIRWRGGDAAAWGQSMDDYEHLNGATNRFLEKLAIETGSRIVDTRGILCRDGLCPGYDAKLGVLYFNQAHLDLAGADLLLDGCCKPRFQGPPIGAP